MLGRSASWSAASMRTWSSRTNALVGIASRETYRPSSRRHFASAMSTFASSQKSLARPARHQAPGVGALHSGRSPISERVDTRTGPSVNELSAENSQHVRRLIRQAQQGFIGAMIDLRPPLYRDASHCSSIVDRKNARVSYAGFSGSVNNSSLLTALVVGRPSVRSNTAK